MRASALAILLLVLGCASVEPVEPERPPEPEAPALRRCGPGEPPVCQQREGGEMTCSCDAKPRDH